MSIHLDPATLGTMQPVSPAQLPQVQPMPKPRRSLRSLAGGIARTGLQTSAVLAGLLFLTLFVAERTAAYAWKPSTMLGAYGGNQEYAHITTALDAKRAEFAMQQEEWARAQQELASVQAANERGTRAYDALFQRGTMLAQQWAEGAKQALLLDASAKIEGLRGRAEVSSTKDKAAMFCDLGAILFKTPACGDALRQSAQSDRDAMTAEIIGNYKAQSLVIATSLRDWAQGMPDPAELMARQVAAYNQTLQAAPRPAPPPSPVYPRDPQRPLPVNSRL